MTLMLMLALCFPFLSHAASTVNGRTNQIIALNIKDTGSRGSKIYEDIMAGRSSVESSSWKSSNESVTRWSEKSTTAAYVIFSEPGNYTVSYDLKYSSSGESLSYSFTHAWEITVTEDGPTGVSVSIDKHSIETGQTTTARATIHGGTGSVTWSKGNSSCISITPSGNTCQIKGISKGTAEVTATTNNGHSDFITVTVTEPAPIPNTIILSKSSIELIDGQTTSITAQITGDNSNVCEWKCSNTEILSLTANGKSAEITAKKEGNAIIYATAYDGTKASCPVTVSKDPDKEFSGNWAIAGNFNTWTDTEMIHQGNGIFTVWIDRLIPEFKFKTLGSWDSNLGATGGKSLEAGQPYTMMENGENITFAAGVIAITDAIVTLNVPNKTVLITGTVEYDEAASSLTDFYGKSGADQAEVTAGFTLTATYVNQQYCYVIDAEGTPGLIYGTTPYNTLDIIPSGWKGKYSKYYGLPEIIPSGTMPEANRKGSFSTRTYNLSDINIDMVNEIVILKNVTFTEDTPSARTNFTGTSSDGLTSATFRNQFYLDSAPAGTYNVMAAIGAYNTELQIYPIEYTEIDPDYGEWCITGAFNRWSDTAMTHQGDGIYTIEIDWLTSQFSFKTAGGWDKTLGPTDDALLEEGKTYHLTENDLHFIKFPEAVTAIKNAYVTLNVPDKTVLITGTVEYNDTYIYASSLSDFFNKSSDGSGVIIDFPLTVTYARSPYCYVIDGEGTPSLIYGTTHYQTNDIIPAGWMGLYSQYHGLPEITPSGAMPQPSETGSYTPKSYNLSDINIDMVNEVAIIKDVIFAEDTPGSVTTFTGMSEDGMTTLTFRNQFIMDSTPSGIYNVLAAIGVYGSELQAYPILYNQIIPGAVTDIEDDGSDYEFYNLQGIKVDNPAPGLYIKRHGSKAEKIIIK